MDSKWSSVLKRSMFKAFLNEKLFQWTLELDLIKLCLLLGSFLNENKTYSGNPSFTYQSLWSILQTWQGTKANPGSPVLYTVHTVSFDWFLFGLEWIIYLEFCYQNFCYFTSKCYRISDLGLTFPHFEFSSLYLDIFDQTYLNTGSKTQNVEELSLDLIFYNNFW